MVGDEGGGTSECFAAEAFLFVVIVEFVVFSLRDLRFLGGGGGGAGVEDSVRVGNGAEGVGRMPFEMRTSLER